MGEPQHNHSEDKDCAACNTALQKIPVKISEKCLVQFRPKPGPPTGTSANPEHVWKGEIGFDWMRIGDFEDDAFKECIVGGYGLIDSNDAYEKIKKEYQIEDSSIKAENKYFIPYLNLYPADADEIKSGSFKGKVIPKSEAELTILIAVESNPEKIEFDFDINLFSVKEPSLKDIKKGDKRIASDKTIKVTCKTKFCDTKEIKALAYPKGAKSRDEASVVGKLKVLPNDESVRKIVKIVLVEVKTNVKGVSQKGTFSDSGIKNMQQALHQALIHAIVEYAPAPLDLTADDKFRIKINPVTGKTEYGDCIYRQDPNKPDKNFVDGGIFYTEKSKQSNGEKAQPSNDIFTYVKKTFLEKNQKYINEKYFTIFSFGEMSFAQDSGVIEDVGIKNAFLFVTKLNQRSAETTLAHEVLHGFGLEHIHGIKDNSGTDKYIAPKSEKQKYIFKENFTYNIMSYSLFAESTLKWQWAIMQENANTGYN